MALNTPTAHEPYGTERSTLYVVVWAVLAIAALAYLALLAVRPDLATGLIVNPPSGSPEGNQGQRAMFRALAEVQDLRKSVTRLEGEVGEMKAAVQVETQKVQALEARIGEIEAAQRTSVPVADAAPASHRPRGAPASKSGEQVAGTTVAGTIEEPAKPRRDQGPPPKVLASAGGAEAKPEERVESPAQPPRTMAVAIATGPSLDALRLTWQLLQEAHKPTLRSLEPRFAELASDPPAYQLIAGPVSAKEAGRACERLKVKQARCAVVPFAGQPL